MEVYRGTPNLIKKVNTGVVIDALKNSPGATQLQISEQTGLSLPTVNKAIRELMHAGKVLCVSDGKSTGGRPAKRYEINQNSGFMACVYVQWDTCEYAVANILGEAVSRGRHERNPGISWTDELFNVIDRMLIGAEKRPIKAVAVAVPGTVTSGAVHNIPAIPEWEGIDLKAMLYDRYNCDIIIENDIDAAAVGVSGGRFIERRKTMVFISILNNIGAGIIMDGKPYKSCRNFTGELAYMTLDGGRELGGAVGAADGLLSELLQNRDRMGLTQLIARLSVNVCCVIDPDFIVISSPHVQDEDIPAIKCNMARFIKPEFIPEIELTRMDAGQCLNGLMGLCGRYVERPMRIVR